MTSFRKILLLAFIQLVLFFSPLYALGENEDESGDGDHFVSHSVPNPPTTVENNEFSNLNQYEALVSTFLKTAFKQDMLLPIIQRITNYLQNDFWNLVYVNRSLFQMNIYYTLALPKTPKPPEELINGVYDPFYGLDGLDFLGFYKAHVTQQLTNFLPESRFIQHALATRPSFQAFELGAELLAKQILCLRDQDQEWGSWIKTYIAYNLFIEDPETPAIQKWLTKKGFPVDLEEAGDDEEGLEPNDFSPTSVKAVLTRVSAMQPSMALDVMAISDFISRLSRLSKSGSFTPEFFSSLTSQWASTSPEGKRIGSYMSQDTQQNVFEFIFSTLKASSDRNEHTMILFPYIKGLLADIYVQKFSKLYSKLSSQKSPFFIVIWKIIPRFLAGLDEETMKDLYDQAQRTYIEQYGHCHPSLPRRVPKRTSDLGTFYSGDDFSQDDSINKMEKIEQLWTPLVDEIGDPLVAYELAKSWANSKLELSESKAQDWYNKYKELAPTLPYGDNSTLKVE